MDPDSGRTRPVPPVPSVADRVDAAMARWPRARHLPRAQRPYAALDRALPIGHGQTNSQPTTVRTMLIALEARLGDRVLDVGSGSAWTTVVLADLVGPTGSVVGVERVPELVLAGQAVLDEAGLPWARIRPADPDRLGAAASGPFDRILVSAMASRVPDELIGQLAPTGVLVVPVAGELCRFDGQGHEQRLGRYLFVPLVGG